MAKLVIERLDGRTGGNVEERAEIEALKAELAELRGLIENGHGDGGEVDAGGGLAPQGAGGPGA